MNKKLIFLFLALLLISKNDCCFPMDYCKLANRIVSNYSRELAKERDLFLIGSGGAMMDDIKEINVFYVSFRALNVREARKQYIEVSEEFLKKINQNEKIRPYLHNYPFIFKNLDLKIMFKNKNKSFQDEGDVALIFPARNHNIFYEGYDSEKKDFYSLHSETYEEALQIVREEANQIYTTNY